MHRTRAVTVGLCLAVAASGCGAVTPVDASATRVPDAGPDSTVPRDTAADRDAGGAFDQGHDVPDGADAHVADGGADQPRSACDPAQPFGAPVALADFNTSANDDGVVLSDDQLTAF